MKNQYFMSIVFEEFYLSRLIIYIFRSLRNIKPNFVVIIDLHISERAEEKVKLILRPGKLEAS